MNRLNKEVDDNAENNFLVFKILSFELSLFINNMAHNSEKISESLSRFRFSD